MTRGAGREVGIAGAATGAARRAFAETVDPEAYVARPACDAVLDTLVAWAGDHSEASVVAAIVAAPGLGKTFLLRTFESRLAARAGPDGPRALYLPYAGLEPVDLAIWVYGLLSRVWTPRDNGDTAGAEQPGPDDARTRDAIRALEALGHPDDPFFLVIDDADSMPPATLQALGACLGPQGGPLRILLALGADSRGSRLLAALNMLAPKEIPLRDPMTVDETGEYLRQRMRWAGFGQAEVDRIDGDAARHFHSLSAGVPRALHARAWADFDRELSRGESPALDEKRRREDWMGRPIDDELEI